MINLCFSSDEGYERVLSMCLTIDVHPSSKHSNSRFIVVKIYGRPKTSHQDTNRSDVLLILEMTRIDRFFCSVDRESNPISRIDKRLSLLSFS